MSRARLTSCAFRVLESRFPRDDFKGKLIKNSDMALSPQSVRRWYRRIRHLPFVLRRFLAEGHRPGTVHNRASRQLVSENGHILGSRNGSGWHEQALVTSLSRCGGNFRGCSQITARQRTRRHPDFLENNGIGQIENGFQLELPFVNPPRSSRKLIGINTALP
jgi:hypothetical protein